MFLRTFGRATLILALFSTAAFAQNTGTVIGTVRASDGGDVIAGVAVRVVGASQAAMTRGDGTFRLQLPAGQHNIQASLIGFAASTATVNVVAGQTVGRVTTGWGLSAGLRLVLVRNARARDLAVETFLVFTRLVCLELSFIWIL